jgi:uncharacterized membrane protein YgaE (UPF0421/DUF939 family)
MSRKGFKYDKDLRLLTYKILLEKFNNQYKDLLPEQKNILKEFIVSVNSSTRLRNVVNEEMVKLQTQISKLKNNITDKVIKIKLEEVSKAIVPVKNTQKVDDNHLVSLMQYYELVNELKSVLILELALSNEVNRPPALDVNVFKLLVAVCNVPINVLLDPV